MNEKHRKIKLKNKRQIKTETIEREQMDFRFTDRYIAKKKRQMLAARILIPMILLLSVPVVGILWDKVKYINILWVLFMLFLVGVFMIYGISRVYGNDIHIRNNIIYYDITNTGTRGIAFGRLVFQAIKKIEVKKSKIVIYGHIFAESGFGHVYKKLAIPKEIENVDEFLRLAQSLVGKE